MKLVENWKRFWTLNRHHAAGFTLVELIVVIAILAILAGVAVPAYSGYIAQANKQADMSLVSEVADALTLYYYSHPNEKVSGYVVLRPNGAIATGDDVVSAAAMQQVFGDNWAQTATLKYDGWNDDGLLSEVAGYDQTELNNIANSTFLTTSSPEGLMIAVTDMTSLVSDVIAGSDLSQAATRLNTLLGPENHVSKTLEDLEMDANDPKYSTVVSNLLVNYLAEELQNADPDNNLSAILGMYTSMFAYAETTGDTSVVDKLSENLSTISFDTLNSDECMIYCFTGLTETSGWSNYSEFASGDQETTDAQALKTMMGAVSMISGSYTDKDSLTNPNLYSSDEVSEQVYNYVNSVKALAGMDPETRQMLVNLEHGAVVVLISENGTVVVTPNAVIS